MTSLLDKFLLEKDSQGGKLFTCDVCNWQTRFGPALKGHKKRMHEESVSLNSQFTCNECEFKTEITALLSAPPRKRLEKDLEENVTEMLDLDNMEIIVEKEISMRFLLEKRIRELESQLVIFLEERKKHEKEKDD